MYRKQKIRSIKMIENPYLCKNHFAINYLKKKIVSNFNNKKIKQVQSVIKKCFF
jgi:hypothetical protein